MDLSLLHSTCKDATRKAFNEYKRQIDVSLFPFDEALHNNFKAQMFQDLGTPVTKVIINNYKLNKKQLQVLSDTINQYRVIANQTANNYAKRFL